MLLDPDSDPLRFDTELIVFSFNGFKTITYIVCFLSLSHTTQDSIGKASAFLLLFLSFPHSLNLVVRKLVWIEIGRIRMNWVGDEMGLYNTKVVMTFHNSVSILKKFDDQTIIFGNNTTLSAIQFIGNRLFVGWLIFFLSVFLSKALGSFH